MTNYIVEDLVPGIIQDAGKFVSLYHHLETKYGIKITSAKDNIKAKVADFLEIRVTSDPNRQCIIGRPSDHFQSQ